MRTRIKICGLTRPEDAAAAVAAGADAVGVVLAPSKRRVTLEQAERVLAGVPASVCRIGVFVDAPVEEIRETAARLHLSAVQLHGTESPEECAAVGLAVAKAFRVGSDFDLRVVEAYRGVVSVVLLDTLVVGEQGGTGVAFDWSVLGDGLPDIARVAIAGGLDPGNVAAAIRLFRPFGVDVSSGVESSPGVKDRRLIEEFVAVVRAADREVSDV